MTDTTEARVRRLSRFGYEVRERLTHGGTAWTFDNPHNHFWKTKEEAVVEAEAALERELTRARELMALSAPPDWASPAVSDRNWDLMRRVSALTVAQGGSVSVDYDNHFDRSLTSGRSIRIMAGSIRLAEQHLNRLLDAARTEGPVDGWKPTHRHKKRGSTYRVIGQAVLQTAEPAPDGAHMIVYQDEKGLVWVRPSAEFYDGRFELLHKEETDHA